MTAATKRKKPAAKRQPQKPAAAPVTETAAKRGRPEAYKPEFCKQAEVMCKLGATDAELAEAFGVSRRSIAAWQTAHPEFAEALRLGKDKADDRVERALFSRAVGYSHEAEKAFMGKDGQIVTHRYIEQFAPDTTAAIFWLKNRRPNDWRDRKEVTGKDGGPIGVITKEMSLTEAVQAYTEIIAAEGGVEYDEPVQDMPVGRSDEP